MGQLLVAFLIAFLVALGLVRALRLPVQWTGYIGFTLLVVALYVFSLADAHAKPWSLWRRSWMQYMGDPDQRRLARYGTREECLKAQWETLDKEFEQQRQLYESMKSSLPGRPKVFLREGRTIFEFAPSMWSQEKVRADVAKDKGLSDYQKERLAFEMSLPEIDATVSVYCAPTLRYRWWPFHTPAYLAATDDLYTLGERTLAIKAKEILGATSP